MKWFDKEVFQYFLGICAGLIGISLAAYLGYLLTSSPKIALADYIQLLILLFISGTMLVAIWTQQKKDKSDHSSDYLNRSVELIDRAYEVLNGDNNNPKNDRVSWVTAARLLQRSASLAREISVDSHRKIYESEQDYRRHQFNELLTIDGKSLPPEFFLGQAMISGDIGKSAYNGKMGKLGYEWIPTRIVSVIYKFKMYPEGYTDPLNDSVDLDSKELDRLWLFDHKGVNDYFTFRKNFFAVGSKVFHRSENEKPTVVTEAEINTLMPSLSGMYDTYEYHA